MIAGYFPYEKSRVAKYSDSFKLRVLDLKAKGYSIRRIGEILDVPYGSLHYILRKSGAVTLDSTRPNMNYLDRKQVDYIYDVSSKTFDYLRGRYPDKFVKVGLRVYGHHTVFEDYYYRTNYTIPNSINGAKRWK